MKDLPIIKEHLKDKKYIVITSHRNPDGDAIGSSLGLQLYLEKLGHNVQVMYPSDYPDFVDFLEGIDKVSIYDEDPDGCNMTLEAADLIFCLDFSSLQRIDDMGAFIGALDTPKIIIDHHLDPEDFAVAKIWDTTASSTCELVYDFAVAMGDKTLIDKSISTALFTGILTDTGGLRYSTTSKLFRTVAELQENGVPNQQLQDYIFNSRSVKQIELLGHCLANRMEYLDEYNTCMIVLTSDDFENFNVQRGDLEGIVNHMLKIKSVKMAALITQQPKVVKLSLRSKGDFSVQQFAQKHFRGGGHKNASGGHSFTSLHSTIKKFKSLLPEFKEGLNKIETIDVTTV